MKVIIKYSFRENCALLSLLEAILLLDQKTSRMQYCDTWGENTISFHLASFDRIWMEGGLSFWMEDCYCHSFFNARHGPDSTFQLPAYYIDLCKLFEKMVTIRLMYILEHGGLLSPSQSGFRIHGSTTDVLVKLESAACEAFA